MPDTSFQRTQTTLLFGPLNSDRKGLSEMAAREIAVALC